jgi:RNA 2',3'-cyclic 3'-phosphodiesterase
MKRIFFAVDIVPGKSLLDAMELARYRLRLEKINWVAAARMHLTLAFMGDQPAGVIPGMAAAVTALLGTMHRFPLVLSSMGVFNHIHDPRVLWVGSSVDPEFRKIREGVDRVLADYDYEPDGRPFSPHLTLGRMKGVRDHNQLAQLITQYKDVVFQEQVIDQVVLYESRLLPGGPEYIPLHRAMLVGD